MFELICKTCGYSKDYDIPYNYKMHFINHICERCNKHVEIHLQKNENDNVIYEIRDPSNKPSCLREWHL